VFISSQRAWSGGCEIHENRLEQPANAPVFPIISGPESLIKARVTGFANVDAIMARLSVFLGRPEECQRRFSAFGR
jgi:hypothetical protein